MKILYHHRTQAINAEGVHVREMIRALEKLGHQVTPVSPPGVRLDAPAAGSGETKGRSPWKAIAAHLPAFLFECLEIAYNSAGSRNCRKAAREAGGIDLVYERHTFFCWSGSSCARAFNIPLFLEVNYTTATPLARRKSRILMPLARRIEDRVLRQAAALFVVSSYLKNDLISRGIPADKIFLTPNAVRESVFALPADGNAVRARFALEDKQVVGYVGAFFPWHGLDFLLDAFAHDIAPGYPASRLLLIGNGPQRESLMRKAADFGIADKVIFAGSVRYEELPAHIAAMDICVLPDSNNYGSPMKIFEYMAAGRAVLAPRLGPLEDVITDGTDGALFTQQDRGDFTRHLRRLLDDRDARDRIGLAARATIMNKHLWRHNAGTLIAAYDKIVKGRGRP